MAAETGQPPGKGAIEKFVQAEMYRSILERGKTVKEQRTDREKIKDFMQNPKKWEKVAEVPDPKQPKGGRSVRELWRNKETGELIEHHVKAPQGRKHPHLRPVRWERWEEE